MGLAASAWRSSHGEELAALTWAQIERDGGNGGQEIRNWISVLAAVPGVKGEVLTYGLDAGLIATRGFSEEARPCRATAIRTLGSFTPA